jgi:hypothetical protein
MTADISLPGATRRGSWAIFGTNSTVLRASIIAAGLCWSLVFILVGLACQLEMFGDGSIFSYAVAVQDAWAIHWHNISGRSFVYLASVLPAEIYVTLTNSARGAVFIYGLLHFSAPLASLLVTWVIDRSKGHVIFAYACLSTACLGPLVFGFPTEIWMAHAVFWPTLALCHYGVGSVGGWALAFAALLALAFTHEGAIVFIAVIVTTLLLRGTRDASFLRCAGAVLIVMPVWVIVKLTFPPDAYYAPVFARAALHFFDPAILDSALLLLLLATIAGYSAALVVGRKCAPSKAVPYAGLTVIVALLSYWLWFDHQLHASDRYYMRTVLVVVTPMFGVLAGVHALDADAGPNLPALRWLQRLLKAGPGSSVAGTVCGAFLLVMLVLAVETTKFVVAWTDYESAVRALALGPASDRELGDMRFVASTRIGASLNRLSWNSTTPFLSVLLAPGLAPSRLVVDPAANYFWLSCETATESLEADRAIPEQSRRLVRIESCLHR